MTGAGRLSATCTGSEVQMESYNLNSKVIHASSHLRPLSTYMRDGVAWGPCACHLWQAAQAERDCQAFLRPLAGDDALRAHAEAVHLTVLFRRCADAGWAAAAGMQAAALLRYLAILPADKAFHRAGAAAFRCMQVGVHAT